MLNQKWLEDFFLTLIDTGFYYFTKPFTHNKLWFSMGKTIDRQKFSFALARVNYYLKNQASGYVVKWNMVIDDFPELKSKIEIYLEKEVQEK